MEADLQRYYRVDYRDRWVRDGRPRLTLRRIWVFLRNLPPDSALITALNGGEPGWTRLEVLMTDVWSALAGGREHPAVTKASTDAQGRRIKTAEQLAKIEAARDRYAKRRRRVAAGEIT